MTQGPESLSTQGLAKPWKTICIKCNSVRRLRVTPIVVFSWTPF